MNIINPDEFKLLKMINKEVVIMVSKLSTNKVEFKKMIVFSYREYIDWIWISCNYLPF